jgi:capsular polysaccharide biosynthesis protein
MDLRAYLSILKRRGWIILVTALVAMILAGGLSLLQTKTYRATARISAVPARPDWGLGSSAKDLLRSFVLNINTHNMANQVIDAASLDMSSYDLLAKLTVSAEPENFAIRIDAIDEDPQVAAKIVLTMAELYVNQRTAYYNTLDKDNRIEVKLVDSVIDAPPYRPNVRMNLIAGFALGALVGALIVLLLEWMAGDILATPDHLRRATGLPVLGAIPVPGKQR